MKKIKIGTERDVSRTWGLARGVVRRPLLALQVLLLAAAASAVEPLHTELAAAGDSQIRLVQIGELTIGDPVNAFNTIAFDQHKLITHGEYQYTLFWDAEGHLAQ